MDILLDILLKPPQPFIGLFFSVYHCVTFDFVGHIQFAILSTSILRLPQKKVPWSLLGPILTLPCS